MGLVLLFSSPLLLLLGVALAGVLGAFVLLVAAVGGFCCWLRRSSPQAASTAGQPSPVSAGLPPPYDQMTWDEFVVRCRRNGKDPTATHALITRIYTPAPPHRFIVTNPAGRQWLETTLTTAKITEARRHFFPSGNEQVIPVGLSRCQFDEISTALQEVRRRDPRLGLILEKNWREAR